MCKQLFHIIGISDSDEIYFSPQVMDVISNGKVFSGGLRHHQLVEKFLPEGALWIDITVPLDKVFEKYAEHSEIVVFASGDPLFFGFANTVQRLLPESSIRVYPTFNSLQMLAHRLLLPYHDMRMVSLTGRPWKAFDAALICGEKMLGVLTDKVKTPAAIAARMHEYGYDNYRIYVGEALGNTVSERVREFTVEEAIKAEFTSPNCMILVRTELRRRPLGMDESEFCLLNGRVNMITKRPVRLQTLSMLDLQNRIVLWDVGSCTGSVSIEAKSAYPDIDVIAFERRPEGEELLRQNSIRWGVPGIRFIGGDFMEQDLSELPRPDAVFIGGHGGRLQELLQRIDEELLPGGIIVFNSVSDDSLQQFYEGVSNIGRRVIERIRLIVDTHNPIEILKAE
ncbi:precorrin-6y C5,15-methyltransferase (decarboxylating) subunit CbiE [uncultured Bacteroides sp.]|uniref:precorrin-6y C5,15-methyltransferase (decarboxylating) subunit CbiE n=1 Tax=uncultured Bacteroides sp. TaxID=162156 RepID=UPI0026317351|nr:precorrin-6y C5,15-methyltransferase (decarboxylating) subunit CbiE [uncultured Bacteroides sp.]